MDAKLEIHYSKKNEEKLKELYCDLQNMLSIQSYILEKDGGIEMLNIIENIDKQVTISEISINNDLEFTYLAAQTISYLCMLSEAEDTRGLDVSGVKMDNIDSIKQKLMKLYAKYKYKLSPSPEHLINKIVSKLLIYTPLERNNKELRINKKLAYLCGVSNKNIVAETIKINKENNKDETYQF